MILKFAYSPGRPERSRMQKKQWALFAAIGYSIAIRGYIACWEGVLRNAELLSPRAQEAMRAVREASVNIEKIARWEIKHLKKPND